MMRISNQFYIVISISILYCSCSTSFKYSYEDSYGPLYQNNYLPVVYEIDSSNALKIKELAVNESVFIDLENEEEGNFYFTSNYQNLCALKDSLGNCKYWMNNNNQLFPYPEFTGTKLKVVSFNIEFAQKIDSAITLLKNVDLVDADVFLFQEMDEKGTEEIAKRMALSYIYYPAINHPGLQQNVGNAILSKWPITSSQKIKLPHPSAYPRIKDFKTYMLRKTASFATILVGNKEVAFYSTHQAAFNTTKKRGEFAKAISDHAVSNGFEYCIVGGDFNSMGGADIESTVRPFLDAGFEWGSRGVGQSSNKIKWFLSFIPPKAFTLDHIFVKGFEVLKAGKVESNGVSDHLPIWVSLELKK